jgi:UPF0271 protein
MSDELVAMGDAAWRIRLPAGTDPAAALETLRMHPGVIDAVVAGDVALVRFTPGRAPVEPRPWLETLSTRPALERRTHVVKARYDGADLDDVAKRTGLSREDVIARHSGREYTVQLVGFLPGFAYLGPVDAAIDVPRRPTPRPRVPAGAIGLAAGRTAVYPFVTPGGWQLIATAIGFAPFDSVYGATLRLGDQVRFEPALG